MNTQMLREIQRDLEIRRNAIKETYTENNFHEIQNLLMIWTKQLINWKELFMMEECRELRRLFETI